jgi:hypothetical protein
MRSKVRGFDGIYSALMLVEFANDWYVLVLMEHRDIYFKA